MNETHNNIFLNWQNNFEKTKVLYGNCLEHMDKMKRGVVNLIITSPPYFNAREYSQWKTYQDYLNFMSIFFDKAYDVSTSDVYLLCKYIQILSKITTFLKFFSIYR